MPKRFFPFLAVCALAIPVLAEPPASGGALPDKPGEAKPEPKAEPKVEPKKSGKTEPTLKLGDKAPSLRTESIKGDLVAGFEPSKVYIVEFWATWCPSCREAIPKLKKLAKNKDIAVIAVASSEKGPEAGKEDKRLEGVTRFVNDRTEQMPFSVVFDADRSIAKDWLVAAHPGLPRYLPFAFVVDTTQTVSWFGDPRKVEFDAAVEKALKPLAPPPPAKTDAKKPDKTAKPKPKS